MSQVSSGTLPAAALAYLGDAVYEVYVRRHHLVPWAGRATCHRRVVAQVRAEAQAHHLQTLMPHLTPAEHQVIQRGRNGAGRPPRTVDWATYRQATALEALVGHLHLTDPTRLETLLGLLNLDQPTPPPP